MSEIRGVSNANRVWIVPFAIWLLVPTVLVFFVPIQVVEEPWAERLTHTMGNIVPSIGNLIRIPGFIPYAAFLHSVVWLIAPLFIVYGVAFASIGARNGNPFPSIQQTILFLLALGLCVSIAFYWPVAGYSVRDRALVSPIGFYMHSLFIWVVALFEGVFLTALFVGVRARYLRQ